MQKEKDKPSVGVTLAWIVGIAMLAAALTQEPGALLIGGLLGYLLAQLMWLRTRTRELSQRLRVLEGAAEPAAPTPGSAPAASVSPVPAPRAETPAPAVSAAPQAARPLPPAPRPPAGPSLADRLKPHIDQGLAWLKRGNPLARIGIVVLFFGGAFLAKYSAERGLLPLEARLVGLAAGALFLLGLGWRLRTRRRTFAQILQGGGVAGFYLTVFAATRLYSLLPQSLALSLLIAVALASAVLAVAQEALALAVIGFAGGFLAPILVNTGSGNHVALFTYYTVLNLGIFTVAWFRAWRVLNLVGFVFTFGITGVFRAFSYSPEKLVSTGLFLLLFFLLYVAVAVLFSLRQKPNLKNYVSGSLVFGLPVVVFGIHSTLVSRIEYGLAFSALGFGVFYLMLAWLVYRSGRENLRLLGEAFAALGVIFASLAIPLAFDQQTTAAMWAVEGAGLLWIGVRQNRKLARAFGVLLQLLAGYGYLIDRHELLTPLPLFNSACIGSVMLGVSGLLSGWWLYRNRSAQARYELHWDTAAALWAVAWWLHGGLHEIDRALDLELRYGSALLYAAITLSALHALAARLAWPLLNRVAIVLLPLAAVAGITAAQGARHPLGHLGYAGWPVLLAVGYGLLKRLERSPDLFVSTILRWLHAGLAWLLALLVAWEASWQTAQYVPGVWSSLPWGLAPALLLALAARPLPGWPLTVHADIYRRLAAPPLVVFATLWIVLANLNLDGDPAWLPYIPLLNPLDISVALALLAIADYVLALSAVQRAAVWRFDRRLPWIAAAAVTFLWLNAALVRSLHHVLGTPLDPDGIRHSFLVQASLSVFWGLLGLTTITIAARRGRRVLWIAGAVMMGVVVAKLFLIDLEGGGTLARIVSFLTVGGLLLLAGYLSPLPPAKAAQDTT
jgi:uncharacterized membrane protein